MTLAAIAGQVGFIALVMVLATVFGGLWLDNVFGTKPIITIVLLLLSVPVTLITMFWVVRQATSRIKPDNTPQQQVTEETDRGTTS